jgi:hypothetical protein
VTDFDGNPTIPIKSSLHSAMSGGQRKNGHASTDRNPIANPDAASQVEKDTGADGAMLAYPQVAVVRGDTTARRSVDVNTGPELRAPSEVCALGPQNQRAELASESREEE